MRLLVSLPGDAALVDVIATIGTVSAGLEHFVLAATMSRGGAADEGDGEDEKDSRDFEHHLRGARDSQLHHVMRRRHGFLELGVQRGYEGICFGGRGIVWMSHTSMHFRRYANAANRGGHSGVVFLENTFRRGEKRDSRPKRLLIFAILFSTCLDCRICISTSVSVDL